MDRTQLKEAYVQCFQSAMSAHGSPGLPFLMESLCKDDALRLRLKKLLSVPFVSQSDIHELFRGVPAHQDVEFLKTMMLLMVERGHGWLFATVLSHCARDASLDHVVAFVHSPYPLNQRVSSMVDRLVKERFGSRSVEISFVRDASLVAGIKVIVGSYMLDLSYKGMVHCYG